MKRPQVRLLNEEVRRAGVDLNCGGGGYWPAGHVGRDHRVMGLGDAGDLLCFRDSAALTDI